MSTAGLFQRGRTKDKYAPLGFTNHLVSPDYTCHEYLPYALFRGGHYGVEGSAEGWLGYAEVWQANAVATITQYKETAHFYKTAETAKRYAIQIALEIGALRKLDFPSSVGKQVSVTAVNPFSPASFPVGETITIMEEFLHNGELFIRGKRENGLEDYLPAGCTSYTPPAPPKHDWVKYTANGRTAYTFERPDKLYPGTCLFITQRPEGYYISMKNELDTPQSPTELSRQPLTATRQEPIKSLSAAKLHAESNRFHPQWLQAIGIKLTKDSPYTDPSF